MRTLTILVALICTVWTIAPKKQYQPQVVMPRGAGGSSSYTVGQAVLYYKYRKLTAAVAQGVQQPYEISIVTTGVDETTISLEMS